MSSRPRDMFMPFRGSALVPREPEAKEGFQIFCLFFTIQTGKKQISRGQ